MIAKKDTEDGHNAAFERRSEEERCGKLVAKYARRAPDYAVAEVRLRLRTIVDELCFLRPAQYPRELSEEERIDLGGRIKAANAAGNRVAELDALATFISRCAPHYFQQSPRRRLASQMANARRRNRTFSRMERVIRSYLVARLTAREFAPRIVGSGGRVKRRVFSRALLEPLAQEWLRDPTALRRFITEVFHHWKTIDEPMSTWRRSLVLHQVAKPYARDPVGILTHLQKIGAVPRKLSAKQQEAQLASIRQMLSREPREALARRKPAVTKGTMSHG
jgi:hypothetical protein